MIGLGSNRLTCCRRGGMSVTQAGRGGMEWGDFSPYSAQATAALQAAFTAAQWVTIRDYGFAHPEIVGYMNAYAPEDAKIAYSLIPSLGTRWLIFDGTGYFDTGLPMNTCTTIEATMKTLNGRKAYFGCSTDSYNGVYQWDSNLWLSSSKNAGALAAMDSAVFKIANGNIKVGNIDTSLPTYGADNLLIGKVSPMDNYVGNLFGFDIDTNDDKHKRYVPFIRSNQAELLDLISGQVATRSGSFTISETPAS